MEICFLKALHQTQIRVCTDFNSILNGVYKCVINIINGAIEFGTLVNPYNARQKQV